jgi:hypothetical protein
MILEVPLKLGTLVLIVDPVCAAMAAKANGQLVECDQLLV